MGKYLMDVGEVQTFGPSAPMTVVGNTGAETFKIQDGSAGLVSFIGSSVERIELSRASTAYSYQATTTGIDVYYGTTKVAQLASGQKMAFTDGAASVLATPNTTTGTIDMSLGGKVISSTAAVAGTTLAPTVTTAASDYSTLAPAVLPAPVFSVAAGATAVNEGATASFTVSMANRVAGVAYTVIPTLAGTGGATTADFGALALDTASTTAGYTYNATTGVLTIPSTITGTTASAVLTTTFVLDGAVDTGEGVTVTLGTPVATTAGAVAPIVSTTATSAATSITDVPVTFTLAASSTAATVYEGASIVYTVTASAPVAADTVVAFSIVPGDPLAADQGTNLTNLNDFSAGSFNPSSVTIAAGTKTASFNVIPAVDTKTELTETFTVKAVVGTTTLTAPGTVLDGNGLVTGQTFTLTTGIDTGPTFLGGAGDDIYNATGSGVNNAFSALDSIDGGAGNNTLNIVSPAATSIAAGQSTVKNIQTANLTDALAVTLDTTGWTGLTALNVSASTGGGALTVGAATAVTQVNTLETGAAPVVSTTINGGTSVNLTATGSITTANLTGDIFIGGTTAPTGVVTVTATETLGIAGSSPGNITVKGGTDVTITDTVKAGFSTVVAAALSGGTIAAGGLPAAVTAASPGPAARIAVTGATGNVVVNEATNVTSTAAVTVNTAPIDIYGGKTITVTESATTTQLATGGPSTVNQANITIFGDATTTTVSVTQVAANTAGNLATAAVTAITGINNVTGVTAGPGVEAVTAVSGGGLGVAAASATAGTLTVANGAVAITDKSSVVGTSTITSVTLNNYANSTFTGSALTSLSLAGAAGTFGITSNATGATMALALNSLSEINLADNSVTDASTKILNITTGATASRLDGYKDANLTTINLGGSSVLTMGRGAAGTTGAANSWTTANNAALATIAVSGAAGLNADLTAYGATLSSVTTTSSGVMTLKMTGTTQAFAGSTGQDVVYLTGDATKAITGGTALTNEVILTNSQVVSGTPTYTTTNFTKNVTNFTTLGVADATLTDVNTYDMNTIFKGFNTIHVTNAPTGKLTFTNVATGTALLIDTAAATGHIEYDLFAASSSGSAAVTLNKTSSGSGLTLGALTLNDSNSDGVATLTVTSNVKVSGTNTITTLNDTGLSILNISGKASLTIGALTLGTANQAVPVGVPSLTINDTTTSTTVATGVKTAGQITTLIDDTLGTLNFTGTNNFTIGTLKDNCAVNLTISNTGTGVATITTLSTDASSGKVITNGLSNLTFTGTGAVNIGTLTMVANTADLVFTNSGTGTVKITAMNDGTNMASTTKLTLTGNIALGTIGDTVANDTPVVFANTTGVTIAGATDNSHVSLSLVGAASTKTDTITLGNANNYVVDQSVAGTVNVTTGSGQDYIALGSSTTNTTGVYNVTLGTDSLADVVVVGTGGTNYNTAPNYVITGAGAGDVIMFGADPSSLITALTAVNMASVTTVGTAVGAVEAAAVAIGAHGVAYGIWNGDTYIAEEIAAGAASGTNTTIVKLTGSTAALTASTGYVTVGASASTATATSLPSILSYAASDANAVTLLAGANTLNLTGTGAGATSTIATTAIGTSLTINDVASAGTGNLTVAWGGVINSVTSLTVNDNTVAQGLIVNAVTDTGLTSATFNNTSSGLLDATGGITAVGLATMNITGSGTGTQSIKVINDAVALLTINDSTTASGDTTVTLTTPTVVSLKVNDSSTGALKMTAFTDNSLTTLNLQNTGTGTLTLLTSGITGNSLTNITLAGAVAGTVTSSVGTAVTVAASTNTGASTIVTGAGIDTIALGSGVTSITGGAGADAITLLSTHAVANTIIYTGVTQGGVTGAGNSAVAIAAGDTIANFHVATDKITVTGVGSGTASAATGVQSGWNIDSKDVFVETGTYAAAGATYAAISTAIGTVTSAGGANGFIAIETAASSNVWNLYEVTVSGAHAPAAIGAGDTISLVGTFSTDGALLTTMFNV